MASLLSFPANSLKLRNAPYFPLPDLVKVEAGGYIQVNGKVCNDSVVLYRVFDRDPENFTPGGPGPPKDHGFNKGARKRLKNAVDNFVNIFEAAKGGKLLDYKHKGVNYTRKPVFMTLTVPKQARPYKTSDKAIKALLARLMDNLRTSHNLNLYIWKAEAQLRGNIHFHLIIDAFVFHKTVRKLWFNLLLKNDLLLKGQTFANSSRIVWMNVIDSVESLKYYLVGYMDQKEAENGRLISKHDKSKTVRQIHGNCWGSSDNLKYKPLTIEDLTDRQINSLRADSLEVISDDDPEGKKWEVLIFKKSEKHKIKNSEGVYKTFYKSKGAIPSDISKVLVSHHKKEAIEVWGSSPVVNQWPGVPESLYFRWCFEL
jgi:hypothetical protein